jgi:hypothetical protein
LAKKLKAGMRIINDLSLSLNAGFSIKFQERTEIIKVIAYAIMKKMNLLICGPRNKRTICWIGKP